MQIRNTAILTNPNYSVLSHTTHFLYLMQGPAVGQVFLPAGGHECSEAAVHEEVFQEVSHVQAESSHSRKQDSDTGKSLFYLVLAQSAVNPVLLGSETDGRGQEK
jgi:hypothetical protein